MKRDTALLRAALVAEARTWLRTPFAHQRREKGIGVDCIGVPTEVGRAFGIPECEGVPYAYTRAPNVREMQRELEARLDYVPFKQAQVADLFWLLGYPHGLPQHLAMVVNLQPLTIIHATMHETANTVGTKRGEVIEHGVDDYLLKTRLRACFRYRGIDG